MTVPAQENYPFTCNCPERAALGLTWESAGCDWEHCPCYDCHTQTHMARMDALCCEAYDGMEDEEDVTYTFNMPCTVSLWGKPKTDAELRERLVFALREQLEAVDDADTGGVLQDIEVVV